MPVHFIFLIIEYILISVIYFNMVIEYLGCPFSIFSIFGFSFEIRGGFLWFMVDCSWLGLSTGHIGSVKLKTVKLPKNMIFEKFKNIWHKNTLSLIIILKFHGSTMNIYVIIMYTLLRGTAYTWDSYNNARGCCYGNSEWNISA